MTPGAGGPIRFAPSTTGYAHPGTLLSALLCWLDARTTGAAFMVRLENLDPDRCRPEYEDAMLHDLNWLGLDWDLLVYQREQRPAHDAALDHLAALGLLYPCACSRSRIKALARPAPDGGWAYDNHCRNQPLPAAGWRTCPHPLRLALPEETIEIISEDGTVIRQSPAREMGDPVLRRRDGAIAYHLAAVVDDHRAGIRRIIRGRDLAPCAPLQTQLYTLLNFPLPVYRHHALLLEVTGGKLAKLHGSISTAELRQAYSPEALCGLLAHAVGLIHAPTPCRPAELIPHFSWTHVSTTDRVTIWDNAKKTLTVSSAPPAPTAPPIAPA